MPFIKLPAMHDTPTSLTFDRINDLYQFLDLPTHHFSPQGEFDIHKLNDIHTDLPFASPVFRANFYSFVFVCDADGAYTTDEQRFSTEPRTIYFTNPGHYKSFTWHRIKDVYLVSLSEAFLKENVHADIFDEFPFLLAETVVPRVLSPVVFAEFEQLCAQILVEYTSANPYRNRIIGNLFVVALLKIKAYFWQDYNPIYEGNRSSQIVRDFKQFLEQHFRALSQNEPARQLQVQDCATASHLHPSYFNAVIKSKTGKSVSTWIAEKTVAEAKALLLNSALSVKEIAYRLGFAEPTHFSNYVKKHTGLSPVQFRVRQSP